MKDAQVIAIIAAVLQAADGIRAEIYGASRDAAKDGHDWADYDFRTPEELAGQAVELLIKARVYTEKSASR